MRGTDWFEAVNELQEAKKHVAAVQALNHL